MLKSCWATTNHLPKHPAFCSDVLIISSWRHLAFKARSVETPKLLSESHWPGMGRLSAHTRSLMTELARAGGASLNLTHAAPPPSVTFPLRPVFAGCRKRAGDWLRRRECRSGGTGANTNIVEQPER